MYRKNRKIRFAALAAFAALPVAALAADQATYEVSFTPAWTAQSHPLDYPKAGLLSAPHFSGIIGATHGAGYQLFTTGKVPSAGIERLSEMGKHDPLDADIKAAIAKGTAGALFETDGIKDLSKPVRFTVTVDGKHPLVSAVAMIAPSPDWFAGVGNVNLMEANGWVVTKTLDVYAYDSGGDDGTTYEAADRDTSPKKATALAGSAHFVQGGRRVPVARITFTRK
ncbi:MAG TPA: spondin domain-containing protein [Steroidobacteraceae bacterium]|nr:spondin domain-containing protein [Steroidobacteraceae bacterium]